MNASDRANRFCRQWKVSIYWNLGAEGDFWPDRTSMDDAEAEIDKGAFRVTIRGEYKRYPDNNNSTHTPSGRAEATLNWEGWTRRGNWEIISIDTEQ